MGLTVVSNFVDAFGDVVDMLRETGSKVVGELYLSLVVGRLDDGIPEGILK